MNSLRRMLNVLNLFGADQPVIDVETICQTLGYTAPSAYRYLRELSEFGLLVRLPRGYALGPKVIALERQMTDYDPLINLSRDLVDQLVADTGLDALISEWYGDSVVNVLIKRGLDEGPASGGRGRSMDLFQSATARVVLANLLPRQIRKVFDSHSKQIEHTHPGLDWKAFNKNLSTIRKQGFCISESELHAGRAGVAAPIFDEKKRILGSMTLVGRRERFHAFQQSFLCRQVTEAAAELTSRIAFQK